MWKSKNIFFLITDENGKIRFKKIMMRELKLNNFAMFEK